MIGRLTGVLIEKIPPLIVLDLGGIGYEVDVPMSTYFQLPGLGEKVTLFIHQHIREDVHLLFGFMSEEERQIFRLLLKISGIGTKTALAILSTLSIADLAHAVADGDIKCLSSVPGIGKKTAERLLLELKGTTVTHVVGANINEHDKSVNIIDDVISALVSLGYSDKEARNCVKLLPKDIDVEEGIRLALKQLVKLS